jgi:hypothetical protein
MVASNSLYGLFMTVSDRVQRFRVPGHWVSFLTVNRQVLMVKPNGSGARLFERHAIGSPIYQKDRIISTR